MVETVGGGSVVKAVWWRQYRGGSVHVVEAAGGDNMVEAVGGGSIVVAVRWRQYGEGSMVEAEWHDGGSSWSGFGGRSWYGMIVCGGGVIFTARPLIVRQSTGQGVNTRGHGDYLDNYIGWGLRIKQGG